MSDAETESTVTPVTETKTTMMEGLKPAAKSSTPPLADSQSMPTESSANWWLTDGVPGVGQKPEYLSPKYKTLAEQAKAYNELHKTLVNTQGAPEQYEFGEYEQHLDFNNPSMQKFMNFAKTNRFSQDAFKEIVGTLVEYQKGQIPNIDAEIARLGPDGA